MLRIYPFGSGSFYTASYATTASFAPSASLISSVSTASLASTVFLPTSGSRGKGVCLISYEDYIRMQNDLTLLEVCNFT